MTAGCVQAAARRIEATSERRAEAMSEAPANVQSVVLNAISRVPASLFFRVSLDPFFSFRSSAQTKKDPPEKGIYSSQNGIALL
jgi:hypothetical protein